MAAAALPPPLMTTESTKDEAGEEGHYETGGGGDGGRVRGPCNGGKEDAQRTTKQIRRRGRERGRGREGERERERRRESEIVARFTGQRRGDPARSKSRDQVLKHIFNCDPIPHC